VLDWHRRAYPDREYAPASEPGVQLVAASYRFMRRHGYATSVMGASFRNVGEIVALAGCDRLTISPALLEELAVTEGSLQAALAAPADHQAPPPPLSEADFRWQMNEDAMATAQLAEGIRGFAADQSKLEALIAQRLWA
jgi:transaldolase